MRGKRQVPEPDRPPDHREDGAATVCALAHTILQQLLSAWMVTTAPRRRACAFLSMSWTAFKSPCPAAEKTGVTLRPWPPACFAGDADVLDANILTKSRLHDPAGLLSSS